MIVQKTTLKLLSAKKKLQNIPNIGKMRAF